MKNKKKVLIKGFTYILLDIYCNEKEISFDVAVDELMYKSLKAELLETHNISDKKLGVLIDNKRKR